MLKIHAVPAFKDNYIWVLEDGRHAVAVDPGDDAPVHEFLKRTGLSLSAVLATHHHADHVGGLVALASEWRCPAFGPAREDVAGLDRRLGEGDRIVVPGLDLAMQVFDIPGHTAGHIAFAGEGRVFCGDTLFTCGCGRLFEGTAAQMVDSLGKLARLPGSTRIYCGHEYTMANIRFAEAVEPGNTRLAERRKQDQAKRDRGEPTVPSTLDEELATNPFLRCAEASVVAAAERRAGRKLAAPVEVFAEIRAWKNAF